MASYDVLGLCHDDCADAGQTQNIPAESSSQSGDGCSRAGEEDEANEMWRWQHDVVHPRMVSQTGQLATQQTIWSKDYNSFYGALCVCVCMYVHTVFMCLHVHAHMHVCVYIFLCPCATRAQDQRYCPVLHHDDHHSKPTACMTSPLTLIKTPPPPPPHHQLKAASE